MTKHFYYLAPVHFYGRVQDNFEYIVHTVYIQKSKMYKLPFELAAGKCLRMPADCLHHDLVKKITILLLLPDKLFPANKGAKTPFLPCPYCVS